jgi:hypothetical protein
MVICFVPGSGGHRYSRFLNNQPFGARNCHMHIQLSEIEMNTKFLTIDSNFDKITNVDSVLLTHTMNSDVIKKFYSNHKVIKIKAPFDIALKRAWITEVSKDVNVANLEFVDKMDKIYQFISWNYSYYFNSSNTLDYECDQLIDIETDTTEFGQVMRRELDAGDVRFDKALKIFKTYGFDAPVIDICNSSEIFDKL